MASIFGAAAAEAVQSENLFEKEPVSIGITHASTNALALGAADTNTHSHDTAKANASNNVKLFAATESKRMAMHTRDADGTARTSRQERKQKRENSWIRQAEGSHSDGSTDSQPSTNSTTTTTTTTTHRKRVNKDGRPVVDTPERINRTVFVGNVHATCKRKALRRFFQEHVGYRVESVRFRSVAIDPHGTMPRKGKVQTARLDTDVNSAHAFVVFHEQAGADAALGLNMHEFAGRHLRVDRATSPSNREGKVEYDRKRTLFVGHIPFDATDEELINIFRGGESYAKELQNQVEAVRHVKDKRTGHGKGVAYVLYKTTNAAKFALTALQGALLRDRELRVQKPSPVTEQVPAGKKKKLQRGKSERDKHAALQKASSYNQAKKRKRAVNEQEAGNADARQSKASRGMAPYEGARTRASASMKGQDSSIALSVEKLKKDAAGKTKKEREQRAKTNKKKRVKGSARISQRKRPAVAARKKAMQQKNR